MSPTIATLEDVEMIERDRVLQPSGFVPQSAGPALILPELGESPAEGRSRVENRAGRQPRLAPTSLGDLADPVDSLIREALPPTPDSIGVDVTAAGDLLVGDSLRSPQQRLRLRHSTMRQARRASHLLEARPVVVGEYEWSCDRRHSATLGGVSLK
jgi:hypothetical protein